MNEKVKHLRQEYAHSTLDDGAIELNPFYQFKKWFEEALSAELPEPHAMNLATVSENGRPSSRIVLLRNFDTSGFDFFTNYESKKGSDLLKNPQVALNFFWQQIERQIRIEGKIEKLSQEESDAYFLSRPTASQIGAWASAQSKPIANRSELEKQVDTNSKKFANQPIQRPAYWGGYKIVPDYFEFWQGRPSRLHDRIAYSLQNKEWKVSRLNP